MTYGHNQTVTLPARFATVAGVAETARVEYVDEVDRFVRVQAGGYTQVIAFEELDQAAQAVTR